MMQTTHSMYGIGQREEGYTVNADDSGAMRWEDLDDDYELFSVGDTADLSGVVTMADDGFFDGIDYSFPPAVEQNNEVVIEEEPEELALSVIPRQQQLVTRVPRHALADAYQLPEEDEGSWVPIIIGIVVALAMLGGLLWLILNSDSCSRNTNPSTPQEVISIDDEDTPSGDPQSSPSDNERLTPTTPENNNENGREPSNTEPSNESGNTDEPSTEPERQDTDQNQDQTQDQEQTTPNQVWVPEQGHFDKTWVVDVEAWDEPVMETRQVGTIHHDEVGHEEIIQAWEEIDPETGETIYHPEEHQWVVDQEAWDEPVYDEVATGDYIHHNEEGHIDQKWVVDVPGHWEDAS